MIINFQGYFFTGANEDVGVDGHHALSVPYGETTTLALSVFYAGKVPYDLTGRALTLTVKRKSYDTTARLTVAGALVPSEGLHRVNFALTSSQMKLVPQRYVYDIWMASGASRNPVVRLSTFHVEASARSL